MKLGLALEGLRPRASIHELSLSDIKNKKIMSDNKRQLMKEAKAGVSLPLSFVVFFKNTYERGKERFTGLRPSSFFILYRLSFSYSYRR